MNPTSFTACLRPRAGHLLSAVAGFCLTVVASLCLPACSRDESAPVEVRRLDLALLSGQVGPDSAMVQPARTLFRLSGYGELNDSTLSRYASNPSIRLHERAVDSVWRDLRPLESSIGRLKFSFSRLFPELVFPSVYAIISPFNQSVFTSDSILYLGLNHYLGADYAPYGYFPDFIRLRKTPERVIPDMAEALLRRDYPYEPQTDYPTLLSSMLYEGALLEAVMQLAGISEQEALSYDDGQMAWLEKNEREVWMKIVGDKMLFSTDRQLAATLVNPAAFTSPIGRECPGMAGRFIGHRIVSSYLDRHAKPLSWLLSPAFYEGSGSLSDSGYK